MKQLRVLWVLGLLAGTLPAEEFKPEQKKPARDLPLGQTYEWKSKAKRPYWYRLPSRIDEKDPPAVIVMCHGTGMDWKWSFWNYPIRKLTWRPHDIVISPESETPRNGFMQKKADRDDVADLITTFKKTFPVGSVYLYGHSQGGFFAYYFAGEKPELVDGVIGHAGNFFKCKTNKKARDSVGIGILHGRADAVVTVDCAFHTDLVYRRDGYRHVNLFVVEGLTEQSGHWPLPWHVNKLLEWQDLLSVGNGQAAVRFALREIAREKPDSAVLLGAARQAVALGGTDVREQVDALGDLVKRTRTAQLELIRAYPQLAEKKPAYGSWAAHVRWAQRAFSDDPQWTAETGGLRKLLAKHEKHVAKAVNALHTKNKKTFATGLKAIGSSFLAAGYDHLLLHLSRMKEKPGKLVSKKELARYDALLAERKDLDKQGADAATAALKPLLDEFRSKHAEWLEPYAPKSRG